MVIGMTTEQMLNLLGLEESEASGVAKDHYRAMFAVALTALNPNAEMESIERLFDIIWNGGRVAGALQRDAQPRDRCDVVSELAAQLRGRCKCEECNPPELDVGSN